MPPNLGEWIELCAGAGVDDEVVGSMWGASGITPPPVAYPPITRVALDRALELTAELEGCGSDLEAARRLRREAIEWLRHPHPRASRQVRQEMRRLEAELEAVDESSADGAHL